MLDWVFEGIITWIGGIMSEVMDAVSGLFLDVLGTDMTVMEEYFPFVSKAFEVMQYTAWSLLFLITVWQLFRAFAGPLTEAEEPLALTARSCLSAFLIGYSGQVFSIVLKVATAPYTALMGLKMKSEDFTFAGVEETLRNGLVTVLSEASVAGTLLLVILMIALAWNYFKLLLETVERYVVVGVLCYTSPLAFSMGASKSTVPVLRSWCRMVGSQLLLLVMNVWFLRGFSSSAGEYVINAGVLSTGKGSIFLWYFCAIAFLKTAQKFDSYLSAMGLNVAQTGGGMGLELLVAARAVSGLGGGMRTAGSVFGGSAAGSSAAVASGMAAGFLGRFSPNSYVRDAVVEGGTRMGAGGGLGFAGRAFGGIAARNGAELTSASISSVASKDPRSSGVLAGEIADRSLANYMPQMEGHTLKDTRVSGGRISTTAISPDGKETGLELYSAGQFEKPEGAASVQAADGSMWYQTAAGAGAGEFYQGAGTDQIADSQRAGEMFPDAPEGIMFRGVDEGVLEATTDEGSSLWYSSAFYEEPDAPHGTVTASDGVDWYAMQQHAQAPAFETEEGGEAYNRTAFRSFMPGFEKDVSSVDGTKRLEGQVEVRHGDGSGTMFYDTSRFAPPRGDHRVYEDTRGGQWYAVPGVAAVEKKPVYEDGKPVYDGDRIRTQSVPAVRYRYEPSRYAAPKKKDMSRADVPRRKQ